MQKTDFCDPWLQVVSEYRKARAIMADVAVDGATEGVWHNLFLEVDKVFSHKHTSEVHVALQQMLHAVARLIQ
jgi:hypothetical protein